MTQFIKDCLKDGDNNALANDIIAELLTRIPKIGHTVLKHMYDNPDSDSVLETFDQHERGSSIDSLVHWYLFGLIQEVDEKSIIFDDKE